MIEQLCLYLQRIERALDLSAPSFSNGEPAFESASAGDGSLASTFGRRWTPIVERVRSAEMLSRFVKASWSVAYVSYDQGSNEPAIH